MNFLLLCAYRAGLSMYKNNNFSFYTQKVVETSLSGRMLEDEEMGYEPEDLGSFGTHEYGFTLDCKGIECSDDLIKDHIKGDVFYSYHPEVGVSVILNK